MPSTQWRYWLVLPRSWRSILQPAVALSGKHRLYGVLALVTTKNYYYIIMLTDILSNTIQVYDCECKAMEKCFINVLTTVENSLFMCTGRCNTNYVTMNIPTQCCLIFSIRKTVRTVNFAISVQTTYHISCDTTINFTSLRKMLSMTC